MCKTPCEELVDEFMDKGKTDNYHYCFWVASLFRTGKTKLENYTIRRADKYEHSLLYLYSVPNV
jgi:hypothetical protein